jgi:hypothetical protein
LNLAQDNPRYDNLGYLITLAFSTAGLYVVTRWPTTRRGLIVSALLLVATLAAFVWLLTQDRRQ